VRKTGGKPERTMRMAHIRYRNGKYRLEISLNGKRVNKSFIKKSDATKYARQVELDIQQKRYLDYSKASRTTLKSILILRKDKKTTSKQLFYKIQKILSYKTLVDLPLTEITPGDLAEYKDIRLDEVSTATVNRELSCISTTYKMAMNEFKIPIPDNPVKSFLKETEVPKEGRRLIGDEEQRILSVMGGKRMSIWWKPLFIFSVRTGMRKGEHLKLCWSDIDFEKRLIKVRGETSKGKRVRYIPLTNELLEILQRVPRSINGKIFQLSYSYIDEGFKSILKKAGIQNYYWHCNRKTAISTLFDKGLSIPEVMSISGHRTLSALMRYLDHEASKLADKLNSHEEIAEINQASSS